MLSSRKISKWFDNHFHQYGTELVLLMITRETLPHFLAVVQYIYMWKCWIDKISIHIEEINTYEYMRIMIRSHGVSGCYYTEWQIKFLRGSNHFDFILNWLLLSLAECQDFAYDRHGMWCRDQYSLKTSLHQGIWQVQTRIPRICTAKHIHE